jgi:threonine/homoserine efflux transporter RhtA
MSRRTRDVLFVLLGVGGLVLKGHYAGPVDELVQSYGGNVAASFAVYFLAKRVTARSNLPHAYAAALAFMVVQLFEVLDGLGLMKNVYDRLDLAANTVGIALAIALDVIVKHMSGAGSARHEGSNTESGKARAV